MAPVPVHPSLRQRLGRVWSLSERTSAGRVNGRAREGMRIAIDMGSDAPYARVQDADADIH